MGKDRPEIANAPLIGPAGGGECGPACRLAEIGRNACDLNRASAGQPDDRTAPRRCGPGPRPRLRQDRRWLARDPQHPCIAAVVPDADRRSFSAACNNSLRPASSGVANASSLSPSSSALERHAACHLPRAGCGHTGGDFGAAFGGRGPAAPGVGGIALTAENMDMQIGPGRAAGRIIAPDNRPTAARIFVRNCAPGSPGGGGGA